MVKTPMTAFERVYTFVEQKLAEKVRESLEETDNK